jgi:hypothetical protein
MLVVMRSWDGRVRLIVSGQCGQARGVPWRRWPMLVRKASRRPRLSSRLGQQKESAPFLPQARLSLPILFFLPLCPCRGHHFLLEATILSVQAASEERSRGWQISRLQTPFQRGKGALGDIAWTCTARLDSTAAATHPRPQGHSSASTASIHFLASCLHLNNIPSQYTVAVRHCTAAHYQLHDSPIV